MNYEQSYKNFVQAVIDDGERRTSRVGDTYQVFGTCFTIDSLMYGQFPILTSRQMFLAPILGELAAFLMGAEHLKVFKHYGCNYWDANAAAWPPNVHRKQEDLLVGRIYGAQWRNWVHPFSNRSTDQIQDLVEGINANPTGRRHIIAAWNPGELDQMCLPPCHILAQFNVRANTYLDVCVTMRSVDLCLGLPSDVILYAALLLLVAKETYHNPGKITFMLGDTHVYANHLQLWYNYKIAPLRDLPGWNLDDETTINSFKPQHLQLTDYKHGNVIKFPLNT